MTKDSTSRNETKHFINRKEIEDLLEYLAEYEADMYELTFFQTGISEGIYVKVRDRPETERDISDYGSW